MNTATAWIDETGEKGLVRNLGEERDDLFALVVALVVPDEHAAYFRSLLEPSFLAFKEATPPNEKLHITDALASKDEKWRSAGYQVRDAIRDALLSCKPVIIYGARRLREARKTHSIDAQQEAALIAAARERRPELDFKSRPSSERLEIQAFDHLILLLDCLGKDLGVKISLCSDHMVEALANACTDAIEDSTTVTMSDHESKVFNKVLRQTEKRTYSIRLSVPGWNDSDLNVTHVEETFTTCDEINPELLAVDVVANDLARHFNQCFSSCAAIYGSRATSGWWGAPLVFGSNRDDMPMLEIY